MSKYVPHVTFSDSHETPHVASTDCVINITNWKYLDISPNKRAINILIYVNLTSKKQVQYFATLVCRINTKRWSIVPYSLVNHRTNFQTIATRWCSLKLRSLYLHICKCDLNETW